jgi:hypothetical protein
MPHLGFGELLIVLLIGLIEFGIPIAFAVGVIIALKRIFQRINAIEQRQDTHCCATERSCCC